MRKAVKILHTLGSCGLVGALLGAVALMAFAPQDTPEAYLQMRQSVAALSDYILLPSIGLVLASGLLSMVVHTPYMNKGWALAKAGLGILMFKGGLHIVGAHGDHAATIEKAMAAGPVPPEALNGALPYEGLMMGTILAVSLANIVLGVWRPKFVRPGKAKSPAPTPQAAE